MESSLKRQTVQREPYSFRARWQVADASGPIAAARPFQWDALNDLPDPSAISFDDGHYYLRAPWRLVRRDA